MKFRQGKKKKTKKGDGRAAERAHKGKTKHLKEKMIRFRRTARSTTGQL